MVIVCLLEIVVILFRSIYYYVGILGEERKKPAFFWNPIKGLFVFDIGVLDSVMRNDAKGKKLRSESQHQKIRMEMTELKTENQVDVPSPVYRE